MNYYEHEVACSLCDRLDQRSYGRGVCGECAKLIILDYEYEHGGKVPHHIGEDTIALWKSLFRSEIIQPSTTNAKRKKRPPSLDLAVFSKDGYACVECNSRENLTVDHITPVAHGGGDQIENLQTLCKSCNSSKGKKPIAEWKQLTCNAKPLQ